jgi:5-formyltetrahydrofolate cyclo-ligase
MSEPHSHALAPIDVIKHKVKAELRKRMRGLRNTTPQSACELRSTNIVKQLGAHPEIQAAKHLALFWPMLGKHEVDLRALDAALRADGKFLYYPSIDQDSGEMCFRQVLNPSLMEERGRGFEEPEPNAPVATELDVIVAPALAVDSAGHRIGYGAGYYDRALAAWPQVCSVVVAYDFQWMSELPRADHDVPCQWIVTDARTVRAEPSTTTQNWEGPA